MSVRSIDRTPDIVAEIRRVLVRFGVEFIGAKDDAPMGRKELQIDLTNTQQVNRFWRAQALIYIGSAPSVHGRTPFQIKRCCAS